MENWTPFSRVKALCNTNILYKHSSISGIEPESHGWRPCILTIGLYWLIFHQQESNLRSKVMSLVFYHWIMMNYLTCDLHMLIYNCYFLCPSNTLNFNFFLIYNAYFINIIQAFLNLYNILIINYIFIVLILLFYNLILIWIMQLFAHYHTIYPYIIIFKSF